MITLLVDAHRALFELRFFQRRKVRADRHEIEAAGLYAFRIDTPGWAPMISVLPAGGRAFGCYTHRPPLVSTQRLEPGEHYVVIDGADKKHRGTYTLSVERCPTDDAKACKAAVIARGH